MIDGIGVRPVRFLRYAVEVDWGNLVVVTNLLVFQLPKAPLNGDADPKSLKIGNALLFARTTVDVGIRIRRRTICPQRPEFCKS